MIRLALVVCSLSFFLQAQTTPTATKTSPQVLPKSTRAGERLLPGQATRIKQPLGYSVAPESTRENFLQFFQENYVRLRAYPGKTINPELRVRAYERLQLQRQELRLRHIGPGWLQRPRVGNAVPEGPGTPGTTGPGGCAWSSLGPTNINGRVTGIGIDPTNSQRLFVTSVGGIWRSIDGGRRWQRLSEDFLATVFASVAVNPANAVEIFAGAGDPNYGGLGAHTATGVWRSGANGDPGSWTKISGNTLDGAVIYKLFVDPSVPNNIYAATSIGVYLGTRNGPNFAWTRIANFDAWTSDLAVDFSVNPRKVYAGVQSASVNFAKGIWKYDGSSWQKRDSGIANRRWAAEMPGPICRTQWLWTTPSSTAGAGTPGTTAFSPSILLTLTRYMAVVWESIAPRTVGRIGSMSQAVLTPHTHNMFTQIITLWLSM